MKSETRDNVKFELGGKPEELDLAQSFNHTRYSCKKCNKFWDTKAFLEEFEERRDQYGGYVKGDWDSIKRVVLENLFRPRYRTLGVACPKCCAEKDRSGGNISVSVIGQMEDPGYLRDLVKDHELYFRWSLQKLWKFGKKLDSDGVVVEND